MKKRIIKYAILTVCGMVLFIVLNHSANLNRTKPSIGGEVFFLTLPVMWWLIEKTIKDFIREHKRIWREINSDSRDPPREHKQK